MTQIKFQVFCPSDCHQVGGHLWAAGLQAGAEGPLLLAAVRGARRPRQPGQPQLQAERHGVEA